MAGTRAAPIYAEPEEDLNMRDRTRGNYSDGLSSSSSSFVDISRTFPLQARSAVSAIRAFFTAPSERKRRVRRHKSRVSMKMGNSSTSSVNSDLAYGTGYIRKRKSQKFYARDSGRKRESSGYGPGRASTSGKKKDHYADAAILEVGAGLAALARKQNRLDLIDGRRQGIVHVKREDDGRVKGISSTRGIGSSRPTHGVDEDGWVSASDDESDYSSSSVDSKLAYGDADIDWGRQPPQPRRRKSTVVDPNLFGPQNSLNGIITRPTGLGQVDLSTPDNFVPLPAPSPSQLHDDGRVRSTSTRKESSGYMPPTPGLRRADSSTSSVPLQHVYPVPTSDPTRFEAARSSVVSAQDPQPYVSRSEPISIQQPRPYVPVSQTIYEQSSYPARTDSQPGKGYTSPSTFSSSVAGVALTGLAGAAIGVGISSSQDDKRDKERERRKDETFDGYEKSKRRGSRKEDEVRIAYDERRYKGDERRRDEYYDKVRDKPMDEHRDYGRNDRYNGKRDSRKQSARNDALDKRPDERPHDSTTGTKVPVDPFQYRVPDDAFYIPDVVRPRQPVSEKIAPAPASEKPVEEVPHAPSVVTVERVPGFARKRSAPVVEPSKEDQPREDRDEKRTQDEARKILEETEQFTAPIDAAAISAAVAAVTADEIRHPRPREFKKGRREKHEASTEQERDLVQEEANRVWREAVLARKIASEKASSDSDPRIKTPPAMEEHKAKSPYDGPDADFELDHIMHPQDLKSFTPPVIRAYPSDQDFASLDKPFDPSTLGLTRPLLNLVRPTPVPSPAPEKQLSRSEPPQPAEPEKVKEVPEPTDAEVISKSVPVSIELKKDDASETSSPVPKSVTWGENETNRIDTETPSEHKKDLVLDLSQDQEPKAIAEPVKKKPSRWGSIRDAFAPAAATSIATVAAAKAKESAETPMTVAQSDAVEARKESGNAPSQSFEYRGVIVEPELSDRENKGAVSRPSIEYRDVIVEPDLSDHDHKDPGPPPSVGPKPSITYEQMPGSFGDDVDFTATVAAGLEDSGFDPNIVIDDPTFIRRSSPPGSDGPGIYQKPFAETVTDLGVHHEEPRSIQESPPSDGLDRRENPEIPWEEREELVEQSNEIVFNPKLNKKEQRKLERDAKKREDEARDLDIGKSSANSQVAEEPEDFGFSVKPSKKDKKSKKSRKISGYEDSEEQQEERDSKESEPVAVEDEWALRSKKLKKKSKRDSEFDSSQISRAAISEISQDDYNDSQKSKKSSERDSSIVSAPERDARSVVSTESSRYEDDGGSNKKKNKKNGGFFDAKSEPDAELPLVQESRPSYPDEWDLPKKKSKKSKGASNTGQDDLDESTASDLVKDANRNGNGISNGNGNHDEAAGDDWAFETKKKRKKDKKRSADDDKVSEPDSFLAKAGTLGAGVGLVGAAAAIAMQHQQSKATDDGSEDALLDRSFSTELQLLPSMTDHQDEHKYDFVDPEITERQFRPSIDPQYGDLLPLPPSNPGTPSHEPIDDLPTLPESRPDSPRSEHPSQREGCLATPRKNDVRHTATKSPSLSAVPLKFILGNRSMPSSPGVGRSSPMVSPLLASPETISFTRPRARPTSWDNSKEIQPLILLDQTRRESMSQLGGRERHVRTRSLENDFSAATRSPRNFLDSPLKEVVGSREIASLSLDDLENLPALPQSRSSTPKLADQEIPVQSLPLAIDDDSPEEEECIVSQLEAEPQPSIENSDSREILSPHFDHQSNLPCFLETEVALPVLAEPEYAILEENMECTHLVGNEELSSDETNSAESLQESSQEVDDLTTLPALPESRASTPSPQEDQATEVVVSEREPVANVIICPSDILKTELKDIGATENPEFSEINDVAKLPALPDSRPSSPEQDSRLAISDSIIPTGVAAAGLALLTDSSSEKPTELPSPTPVEPATCDRSSYLFQPTPQTTPVKNSVAVRPEGDVTPSQREVNDILAKTEAIEADQASREVSRYGSTASISLERDAALDALTGRHPLSEVEVQDFGAEDFKESKASAEFPDISRDPIIASELYDTTTDIPSGVTEAMSTEANPDDEFSYTPSKKPKKQAKKDKKKGKASKTVTMEDFCEPSPSIETIEAIDAPEEIALPSSEESIPELYRSLDLSRSVESANASAFGSERLEEDWPSAKKSKKNKQKSKEPARSIPDEFADSISASEIASQSLLLPEEVPLPASEESSQDIEPAGDPSKSIHDIVTEVPSVESEEEWSMSKRSKKEKKKKGKGLSRASVFDNTPEIAIPSEPIIQPDAVSESIYSGSAETLSQDIEPALDISKSLSEPEPASASPEDEWAVTKKSKKDKKKNGKRASHSPEIVVPSENIPSEIFSEPAVISGISESVPIEVQSQDLASRHGIPKSLHSVFNEEPLVAAEDEWAITKKSKMKKKKGKGRSQASEVDDGSEHFTSLKEISSETAGPSEKVTLETAPSEIVPQESAALETALSETLPSRIPDSGTILPRTATLESFPVEATPSDILSSKTVAIEITSSKPVPSEVISSNITLPKNISSDTSPGEIAQSEIIPSETIFSETSPLETVIPETLSLETAPGEIAKSEILPSEASPSETIIPGTILFETVPVEIIPSEIVTGKTIPAETALSETVLPEILPSETLSSEIAGSETITSDAIEEPLAISKSIDTSLVDVESRDAEPAFDLSKSSEVVEKPPVALEDEWAMSKKSKKGKKTKGKEISRASAWDKLSESTGSAETVPDSAGLPQDTPLPASEESSQDIDSSQDKSLREVEADNEETETPTAAAEDELAPAKKLKKDKTKKGKGVSWTPTWEGSSEPIGSSESISELQAFSEDAPLPTSEDSSRETDAAPELRSIPSLEPTKGNVEMHSEPPAILQEGWESSKKSKKDRKKKNEGISTPSISEEPSEPLASSESVSQTLVVLEDTPLPLSEESSREIDSVTDDLTSFPSHDLEGIENPSEPYTILQDDEWAPVKKSKKDKKRSSKGKLQSSSREGPSGSPASAESARRTLSIPEDTQLPASEESSRDIDSAVEVLETIPSYDAEDIKILPKPPVLLEDDEWAITKKSKKEKKKKSKGKLESPIWEDSSQRIADVVSETPTLPENVSESSRELIPEISELPEDMTLPVSEESSREIESAAEGPRSVIDEAEMKDSQSLSEPVALLEVDTWAPTKKSKKDKKKGKAVPKASNFEDNFEPTPDIVAETLPLLQDPSVHQSEKLAKEIDSTLEISKSIGSQNIDEAPLAKTSEVLEIPKDDEWAPTKRSKKDKKHGKGKGISAWDEPAEPSASSENVSGAFALPQDTPLPASEDSAREIDSAFETSEVVPIAEASKAVDEDLEEQFFTRKLSKKDKKKKGKAAKAGGDSEEPISRTDEKAAEAENEISGDLILAPSTMLQEIREAPGMAIGENLLENKYLSKWILGNDKNLPLPEEVSNDVVPISVIADQPSHTVDSSIAEADSTVKELEGQGKIIEIPEVKGPSPSEVAILNEEDVATREISHPSVTEELLCAPAKAAVLGNQEISEPIPGPVAHPSDDITETSTKGFDLPSVSPIDLSPTEVLSKIEPDDDHVILEAEVSSQPLPKDDAEDLGETVQVVEPETQIHEPKSIFQLSEEPIEAIDPQLMEDIKAIELQDEVKSVSPEIVTEVAPTELAQKSPPVALEDSTTETKDAIAISNSDESVASALVEPDGQIKLALSEEHAERGKDEITTSAILEDVAAAEVKRPIGYSEEQLELARQMKAEFEVAANKKSKKGRKNRKGATSIQDDSWAEEISATPSESGAPDTVLATQDLDEEPMKTDGFKAGYNPDQLSLAKQLQAEFDSGSKKTKKGKKTRKSVALEGDSWPEEISGTPTDVDAQEPVLTPSRNLDEEAPQSDGFKAGYNTEQLALAKQLKAEFGSGAKSKKGKKGRSTSQTPSGHETASSYFDEPQSLQPEQIQEATEKAIVDEAAETPKSLNGLKAGYNAEQLELARQLKEEFSSGSSKKPKKDKKRQSLLRTVTDENLESKQADDIDSDKQSAGILPADEPEEFAFITKKSKKDKKRQSMRAVTEDNSPSFTRESSRDVEPFQRIPDVIPATPEQVSESQAADAEDEWSSSKKSKKGKEKAKRKSLARSLTNEDAPRSELAANFDDQPKDFEESKVFGNVVPDDPISKKIAEAAPAEELREATTEVVEEKEELVFWETTKRGKKGKGIDKWKSAGKSSWEDGSESKKDEPSVFEPITSSECNESGVGVEEPSREIQSVEEGASHVSLSNEMPYGETDDAWRGYETKSKKGKKQKGKGKLDDVSPVDQPEKDNESTIVPIPAIEPEKQTLSWADEVEEEETMPAEVESFKEPTPTMKDEFSAFSVKGKKKKDKKVKAKASQSQSEDTTEDILSTAMKETGITPKESSLPAVDEAKQSDHGLAIAADAATIAAGAAVIAEVAQYDHSKGGITKPVETPFESSAESISEKPATTVKSRKGKKGKNKIIDKRTKTDDFLDDPNLWEGAEPPKFQEDKDLVEAVDAKDISEAPIEEATIVEDEIKDGVPATSEPAVIIAKEALKAEPSSTAEIVAANIVDHIPIREEVEQLHDEQPLSKAPLSSGAGVEKQSPGITLHAPLDESITVSKEASTTDVMEQAKAIGEKEIYREPFEPVPSIRDATKEPSDDELPQSRSGQSTGEKVDQQENDIPEEFIVKSSKKKDKKKSTGLATWDWNLPVDEASKDISASTKDLSESSVATVGEDSHVEEASRTRSDNEAIHDDESFARQPSPESFAKFHEQDIREEAEISPIAQPQSSVAMSETTEEGPTHLHEHAHPDVEDQVSISYSDIGRSAIETQPSRSLDIHVPTERQVSPEPRSLDDVVLPYDSQWQTPSRLPPVLEEDTPEHESDKTPPNKSFQSEELGFQDVNRDSAFVTGSPIPQPRSLADNHEYSRDSGVHLREWNDTPSGKKRSPVNSKDDPLSRMSWPPVNEEAETVDLDRSSRHRKEEDEKFRRSPMDKVARAAIALGGTGVALAAVGTPKDKELRSGSPRLGRKTPDYHRLQTPDHAKSLSRPGSVNSNRSSPTPPLRRSDRKLSGDLRSLSQRSQPNLAKTAKEAERSPTTSVINESNPIANEGRVRAKDMADIYVSTSNN
jgi:hypothetical protein